MRDWTDFRKQFNAMLDAALPDADADAKEIARLESELRAARRSLEYAQAECNALLGEVRRLRWEGTRGDWLRELWTALGVPAQAQALAEVKRLQRQASEVLRATGAQSHEQAIATIRALHHAAASGAEVAGEASALREEISAARAAVGEAWFAGEVSLAEAIHRKCAALEALENAGNPAGQRAPETAPPPASGVRAIPVCANCGRLANEWCRPGWCADHAAPSADTGIAPGAVEVPR